MGQRFSAAWPALVPSPAPEQRFAGSLIFGHGTLAERWPSGREIAAGAVGGAVSGAIFGLVGPFGGAAAEAVGNGIAGRIAGGAFGAVTGAIAGGAGAYAGAATHNFLFPCEPISPWRQVAFGAAFGAAGGFFGGFAAAARSAGAAARSTTSMAPIEAGATEEAENSITLYRGVDASHPGYADALEGTARPRGGSATPVDHVLGDTRSEFTSWTSDLDVAEGFATRQSGSGVILSKTFSQGMLIPSPGNLLGIGESEFLVPGPVKGANVMRVPPW
jgi:hypothetical protein